MTTRAYCFRCLVAALVLCYATACDPRLLRSILSGCSPPQDVPYANAAKTKRLDRDLFVLFNGGISGYINPAFSGRLVLEARDKETGRELYWGGPISLQDRHCCPDYYALSLEPVPLAAGERYYVRFATGFCGDGEVFPEYKLWLEGTGKRTLMFDSSTPASSDELVRQFDWDDLLDERHRMNPVVPDEWMERALNRAGRGRIEDSLADLEEAVAMIRRRRQATLSGEPLDPVLEDAGKFVDVQRLKFLVSMVDRRYEAAEDGIRAITENTALRRRLEYLWRPEDMAIRREDLYHVLVLKLRKKEEEATRLLTALIDQSVRLDNPCLRDFAGFLAGKLDRDTFLQTKDSCRLFGYGSQTSKLFWIAAKAWTAGDKRAAGIGFRAYLDQEARTSFQDVVELSIAHSESGIPCEMPKGVMLHQNRPGSVPVCPPPDNSRRP